MTTVTEALKAAHRDLYQLDGLKASGDFGRVPVDNELCIDTTETLNKIEQALGDVQRSLQERIETAYDGAVHLHRKIEFTTASIQESETRVKLVHQDDYMAAKNGDQRTLLMSGWLRADEDYMSATEDRQEAEIDLKLVRLEIERLRLLVELAKAGER